MPSVGLVNLLIINKVYLNEHFFWTDLNKQFKKGKKENPVIVC